MLIALQITADNPDEIYKILNAIDAALTPQQKTHVQVTAEVPAPLKEPAQQPFEQIEQPVEQPSEPPPPKPRGRPPKTVVEPPKEESARKLKVVPKEEAAVPKQVTMVDVRNAMVSYLGAHGEAKSGELLKEHGNGAVRLSELKPECFAAVYAAATKPEVKKTDVFDDDISDVSA